MKTDLIHSATLTMCVCFLFFSVTYFLYLYLSIFLSHVYLHIRTIFLIELHRMTVSIQNRVSLTVPAFCHIDLSIYLNVYTFSNSSLFCFTLQRYSSQRAEGTSSPVCATFLVLFRFSFFFHYSSISCRILCLSRPSLSHSRCISTTVTVSLSYCFVVELVEIWKKCNDKKYRSNKKK